MTGIEPGDPGDVQPIMSGPCLDPLYGDPGLEVAVGMEHPMRETGAAKPNLSPGDRRP